MKSPVQFKQLLSRAVRTIALQENKTIQLVHDELGYELGRQSGSCIDYWRRGNCPADPDDSLKLAKAIARRQGLEKSDLVLFLKAVEPWLPQSQIDEVVSALSVSHQRTVSQALPKSPFIVGPPITNPDDFYGRSQELQRMQTWWKTAPLQNVAIVGPKRSGKTSLLHITKHLLTKNKAIEYRSVFVDFQDPRMLVQDRLLRYLLQQLGLPSPERCTLEQFMDIVAFQLHQPTIILLDELVAGLESTELNEPFWWGMRSWVSHFANGLLAFALTAHDFPMQLAEDQGKPSPFFNMFNTIELGPLRRDEAKALIDRSPQPFSDEEAAWILAQSQCWPFLVQLLCQTRLDDLLGNLPTQRSWRDEARVQMARFQYLLA